MLLSMLMMLFACSCQASHYLGTVMTYYPNKTYPNGSITVDIRFKLNFVSCSGESSWTCPGGDCGTENSLVMHTVYNTSGYSCQREGIMARMIPSNAPFQLQLGRTNWISDIKNGIGVLTAVTLVELRKRSDTNQANRSPQTTILPVMRVPSNCLRDLDLLTFDPDGDHVKCRYGSTALSECSPCTPPSVLSLSSSCSLSFSPTNSSNEGRYAVELVMEDFPRQNITLTQTDNSQTSITPHSAISKIPVQFVFIVDPVVDSCTEGQFLPKFLPPTPANGARLYTPVNQMLEISIKAEANISTISELMYSGPHNVINTTDEGQFILRWTPSEDEDGESHPICFIAQAVHNSQTFQSELRCVIVSVGYDTPPAPTSNKFVIRLKVGVSSSSPLPEDFIKNSLMQQLKEELERQELPPHIILTLRDIVKLKSTSTAPPGDCP